VSGLATSLQRTVRLLLPHRSALLESWIRSAGAVLPAVAEDVRPFCTGELDAWFGRLERGELDALLADEGREVERLAREGTLQSRALALDAFDRCCVSQLVAAAPDPDSLAEGLHALGELSTLRLALLLQAREDESARRLVEAQEETARAAERARELARTNDALRRSESQSQHRAEQIALLGSVVHRIAPVLEPERLMQEAAETIQARMNHTYVAIVVLDDVGVLVGRWAGRAGVGRRSAGRTQGPAGGVIGRALRKKSPQVVADVSQDPDYHPDVPGTRSEMVIPLLDGGEVVGAIDFQAARPGAFDLDAVAVGETLAEFLVVALRNARLYAEARRARE
jgi:putative methionine-R-sulfoxide reductase with GAF domain